MHHTFLNQSSVYGHLGHSLVLAIINSAAVNSGLHVSFQVKSFYLFWMHAQKWGCWIIR